MVGEDGRVLEVRKWVKGGVVLQTEMWHSNSRIRVPLVPGCPQGGTGRKGPAICLLSPRPVHLSHTYYLLDKDCRGTETGTGPLSSHRPVFLDLSSGGPRYLQSTEADLVGSTSGKALFADQTTETREVVCLLFFKIC